MRMFGCEFFLHLLEPRPTGCVCENTESHGKSGQTAPTDFSCPRSVNESTVRITELRSKWKKRNKSTHRVLTYMELSVGNTPGVGYFTGRQCCGGRTAVAERELFLAEQELAEVSFQVLMSRWAFPEQDG